MNRNITKIAILIMASFLIIMGYLSYIQIVEGNQLLNHPRNRRLQLIEESVVRGKILDNAGKVFAETVSENGKLSRIYPFGTQAAHVTGYSSRKLGKWGIEASFNAQLLGLNDNIAGQESWALRKIEKGQTGNDVITSIDMDLQLLAYRMLGDRRGAVVAIEPSTGRILAMVSRPGFNPGDVERDWEQLKDDPASPLLNRVAQGLYPPGSTMKTVTAAGILEKSPDVTKRVFDAPGYVVIEGRRIEDRQAVGRLNLTEAVARSSNYVFAKLGIELGAQAFIDIAQRFGINKSISFELPAARGRLPEPESLSNLELAGSAIGQGRVMVTPLNMALVAAGIANEGTIMLPTIVDKVVSPKGELITVTKPKVWQRAFSSDISGKLRDMLSYAVSNGTGRAAAIPGVTVAGKTGSAENPHGQAHAWFIGFAPAEQPVAAVAVIIENGGAGGAEAAPIAGEILKAVIGQKR